MLVLKTTSPNRSPLAPMARPVYTVPSSRAGFASSGGGVVVRSCAAAQHLIHYVATPPPHHLITAVPQVRPAPKPLRTVTSPGLSRPSAIASSTASGIEPADVFP